MTFVGDGFPSRARTGRHAPITCVVLHRVPVVSSGAPDGESLGLESSSFTGRQCDDIPDPISYIGVAIFHVLHRGRPDYTTSPRRNKGDDLHHAADIKKAPDGLEIHPAPLADTTASAPKSQRDSRRQAAKRASRPACGGTSAPKAGARAGRAIPVAVKREIWRRDGGRCRYVDPRTGRRCVSRYLLQRRSGAEQPQIAVCASSPTPPCGAGFTARARRVSITRGGRFMRAVRIRCSGSA